MQVQLVLTNHLPLNIGKKPLTSQHKFYILQITVCSCYHLHLGIVYNRRESITEEHEKFSNKFTWALILTLFELNKYLINIVCPIWGHFQLQIWVIDRWSIVCTNKEKSNSKCMIFLQNLKAIIHIVNWTVGTSIIYYLLL